MCSCKYMHFCNISFLGTSTLFERNVYSKVRCITLHFFPFFYPQHLVSNKFNNQNLKPLTLTLIMTPAQALLKTSVTVTNSLILDYTLNLLMTLFLWSNYLLIVTTTDSNNLFVGYNVCCRRWWRSYTQEIQLTISRILMSVQVCGEQYLLTTAQKSLFYFYFYFSIILPFKLIIYMKFKKRQDEARELKEANRPIKSR